MTGIKHTHEIHRCSDSTCGICNGGLSVCEICAGAEASLPTDCPGRLLTEDEGDQVMFGYLDFRDGCWVTEVIE
jgi:hypothetical protein